MANDRVERNWKSGSKYKLDGIAARPNAAGDGVAARGEAELAEMSDADAAEFLFQLWLTESGLVPVFGQHTSCWA